MSALAEACFAFFDRRSYHCIISQQGTEISSYFIGAAIAESRAKAALLHKHGSVKQSEQQALRHFVKS